MEKKRRGKEESLEGYHPLSRKDALVDLGPFGHRCVSTRGVYQLAGSHADFPARCGRLLKAHYRQQSGIGGFRNAP
jgi:hypothetical protein